MRVPPRASRLVALPLVVALAGCGTTAASFVEQQAGSAVVKGRAVRLENITTGKVQPLSDGTALELAAPGRVTLEFADGNRRTLDVAPGSRVVLGVDVDYVIREEAGGGASMLPER